MADINIENLNKDRIKLVDEIKQKQEQTMADCVSLPNAAELVELLRRFDEHYISEECGVSLFCNCLCEHEDCIVVQAADAIEQLMHEKGYTIKRAKMDGGAE